MKKRLMRCLSLLLCAVLLSVPALAAEPAAGEPARQGPVRVWGTVTWLDNGGLLVENSNESDPLHEVVLHGESIICLDAVTGESMELEQIKDGAFVIALAIDGKMLDSVELAEKINKLGIGGVSQLVFVIGGSLGLSEAVLSRADYRLSFSRMTFPHQLMRVILLEQIYRSYRIIHKEPYHK